ncbi:MAG: D-arabitol-phosphate dehydrogenase [Pelotomaculum sp. PtaB.Bin104]|nr:MAG: D-arabitol-phosphate dehydrogenase [Pelotomaculum sp. PtaB.Bin104]
MLQAIIKKGKIYPEEVPVPQVQEDSVLVKAVYSCISAGTEISSLQEGGRSLVKKALEKPDKVKQVLEMARREGVVQTMARVKGKLDTGSPTGYSVAGVVVASGRRINDLKTGDRVACAGAGIANHAEYVSVPRNLAVKIPPGVEYSQAATVALGSIAMHGVRRTQVQLGEFVVIFGLGILGQLALQMVRAAGARCIGVDIDQRRLALAGRFGAELMLNPEEDDIIKQVLHLTGGHGADAVIFTAAATDPAVLSQAFTLTRRKGRLVMVGVYGKELNRDDIYKKEIDFLISTSYGPGRYDEQYELKGLDYPYAYVRWTEGRNMEEYLRLLDAGIVDVKPIIEAVYPIAEVQKAYESLNSPQRPLIVLLEYGQPSDSLADEAGRFRKTAAPRVRTSQREGEIRVGLIGAGSFATGMHLPNMQKLKGKYRLQAVCSRTGYTAKAVAGRFQAGYSTTDPADIFSDQDIDLVIICTRHNNHTDLVMQTLQAGKHVFVEKPLALNQAELNRIKEFYAGGADGKPLLAVGFNRRFSKYAREAKKHTDRRINPLFMHYRMNAGYIPLDHWVHTEEGGGRIIGEACHIIDLFTFFTGCAVRSVAVSSLSPNTDSLSSSDNKVITLEYVDGSVATLEYFAVGSKQLPKETMEIHFDEKSIIIDDYKGIKGYGLKVHDLKSSVSEKGQLEELEALYECLASGGGRWPIELWDLVQTTEITFMAVF